MVIAVGLSLYNVGLFHLINHAFYKALLFLGAGAVIHAVGDNQDLRKYGGLRSFLPLTYSVMLIASLSLVAFPFMTGFYSKDLILESAYGLFNFSGTVVYFIATIGAMFTTLYSVKVLYLTYFTDPNGPFINYGSTPLTTEEISHDDNIDKLEEDVYKLNELDQMIDEYERELDDMVFHLIDLIFDILYNKNKDYELDELNDQYNKSYRSEERLNKGLIVNYKHPLPSLEGDIFMTLPLIILAFFSIFFGNITKDIFRGLGSGFFADNSIFIHPTHENNLDTEFAVPTLFKLLPLMLTILWSNIVIVLLEFYFYLTILIWFKLSIPGYNIFSFFNQRFLIELFYNKYITNFILELGGQTTKVLDKGSVELLGPFGFGKGSVSLSVNIASLNKGVITSYALYILIGLIVFILIPYISWIDNTIFLLLFLSLLSLSSHNNNNSFRLPSSKNSILVSWFMPSSKAKELKFKLEVYSIIYSNKVESNLSYFFFAFLVLSLVMNIIPYIDFDIFLIHFQGDLIPNGVENTIGQTTSLAMESSGTGGGSATNGGSATTGGGTSSTGGGSATNGGSATTGGGTSSTGGGNATNGGSATTGGGTSSTGGGNATNGGAPSSAPAAPAPAPAAAPAPAPAAAPAPAPAAPARAPAAPWPAVHGKVVPRIPGYCAYVCVNPGCHHTVWIHGGTCTYCMSNGWR